MAGSPFGSTSAKYPRSIFFAFTRCNCDTLDLAFVALKQKAWCTGHPTGGLICADLYIVLDEICDMGSALSVRRCPFAKLLDNALVLSFPALQPAGEKVP